MKCSSPFSLSTFSATKQRKKKMSAKSQRSPYKHNIVNSHFYHFTQFSQPPTQIKKKWKQNRKDHPTKTTKNKKWQTTSFRTGFISSSLAQFFPQQTNKKHRKRKITTQQSNSQFSKLETFRFRFLYIWDYEIEEEKP